MRSSIHPNIHPLERARKKENKRYHPIISHSFS
jgi:hypothetical protein